MLLVCSQLLNHVLDHLHLPAVTAPPMSHVARAVQRGAESCHSCRNLTHLLEQLSMPDIGPSTSLGDLGMLNSAVAMLHERDVADVALQHRRSSVLLNYVDNRLGAPEGQILQNSPMLTEPSPSVHHFYAGVLPACHPHHLGDAMPPC